MNKDNQIMSLLSDIDEEFIDDILEIPQKPVESYGAVNASGKSLFLKFAAPIAACLAVAGAAVGVLAALKGNGVAPVVSEEATTTAEITLPEEVSEKDLEDCKRYFETNILFNSESEYTTHIMDMDFDGTYEIYYFPKFIGKSYIYVFRKTHGSYNYSGEIDTFSSDCPLHDFEDIMLFDSDGEKYYYYYYYDMQREEKGIAYFLPDNGVKSLLSYGCLNPYEMNSVTGGRSLRYCKKGDEYIDFEEFQQLWGKYEGIPAIKYEEYWANEEVTLDGAKMMSDMPGGLPNFQEGNIISGDCFYKDSVEKLIISQMECGKDYKATILGYNVISHVMGGEIYVDCYKAKLVISDSSGKIIDVQRAHSPYVRTKDDSGWEIPLATIEDNICLDVVDFGENQIIMLRNSGNSVCEKTLLFGVKEDGTLYACVRTDLPEDERFDYCPYISGAYSIEGKDTEYPVLVDSLTKSKYVFDLRSSENLIFYSVIDRDALPEYGGEIVNISDYIAVEERQIPFIDFTDLDFKEMAQAVLQNSLPKVLFAQETVIAGDSVYDLYMIGENVRRSIEGFNSDEYIYCNNVKTAIFKDGVYLGSVKGIYNHENPPFTLGTDFDEFIAKGYYCEKYDALLITKLNPLYFSEYGDRCFAAVKDGKLYQNLSGSYKEIDNNPKPEGLESSDKIEINGNELSCADYVFRFNFDSSGFGLGDYDYEVYWRDEGAE